MFEKKVILIQLGIFTGLLLLIFGTISLMNNGIISKDYIHIFFPTAMIGSAILGFKLIGKYQRGKVFRSLIEGKLSKEGYEFVNERPLNMGEILENLEFAPTILVNGTPIDRFNYKARNERMVHVRTDQGQSFLLHVVITKTWKDELKLTIVKKNRIDYTV